MVVESGLEDISSSHDLLHVMSALCVARDSHTIAPGPFECASGVALTFEILRIANAQRGKNCVSSPAAKATISTD